MHQESPMTSSEDHFRAAEKFLEEAESHREPDTRADGAWSWRRRAYARFSEVKRMKHRDGLSRRYRHL
jgi:hypothetical protein